ncbi:dienelactone hydrolase family protein [Actinoplanes sp. NEAU-A12]|uniref:Dienelactone hydrolase family protein n=1 Tax=Actinoplanes sandaracinus TaxID=3045177 RepID=A0ABT6WZT5_9ACTN|nr:alpha/beta family hydrolase [Actinoplanes sandaracinus]MDI6105270.1 dienelactone hydrolase family protein [Actinoplanes sandaracinus]
MSTWTTASRIRASGAELDGDLTMPAHAGGLVLFAHGSGSSRHSPRNRAVAGALNQRGMATLLVDLLTADEERVDERTRELRFDIGLLADRLIGIIDWLREQPETAALPIGLFGASTGAAAALVAAAARPDAVLAVVSRGGRPDLAGPALLEVRAPTLLIVGEQDAQVSELNEQARNTMQVLAELRIIATATHLFEEPGALEQVAEEAGDWFGSHLVAAARNH